jgi:FkbM family methyltransferase
LVARVKALLSHPLERATARGIGPLVAKLEATIARHIEQIEARQQGEAADFRRAIQTVAEQLGRRLEQLEGQASRQEQATRPVSELLREMGEGLWLRLARLEEQASRQEQAIKAVSERLREASAALGQTLERIEAELSRQQQASQAATGQQNNDAQALRVSLEETQGRLNDIAQKVDLLNETVEKLPTFQTLKGLGIEDHLLESYGSAPPLHPIGDWHIGTGIDNPTNLLKERVRKWNALTQPALLVWHADLKVMLWPGNENSRALFITGTFEPSEMSWLADNLKDDMVFIDVGANIGIYTMFAAKLVGAGGRVLAVEPSEREFQRLSFHVVLNDLGNVTCLRFAAADKMGVGKLKVASEEKSGQNTLGKFVTETTELLRVETVRMYPLDRVIAEHKLARVDVVKIDVEGAELRVLRGLASTIERWRPKLLIELAPDALAAQNTSSEALVEWLRDSRYELFEFSRTTGALQKFGSASVEHTTSKNFVAVPAE